MQNKVRCSFHKSYMCLCDNKHDHMQGSDLLQYPSHFKIMTARPREQAHSDPNEMTGHARGTELYWLGKFMGPWQLARKTRGGNPREAGAYANWQKTKHGRQERQQSQRGCHSLPKILATSRKSFRSLGVAQFYSSPPYCLPANDPPPFSPAELAFFGNQLHLLVWELVLAFHVCQKGTLAR